MKNLSVLFLIALLFSCSGNEENKDSSPSNILEGLTITVDTLVMDPGEDIFNLGMGIRSLDLSQDKKFLYYFENMPPKLLKVDLEKKSLISKTEFKSEGPNGIGVFVGTIQVGPDGKLALLGNNGVYGVFDQNGTKLEKLNNKPAGIDPNLAENNFNLYGNAIYDWENRKIFSWPLENDFEKSGLVTIDLASNTAKIIEAPEMEIVDQYSIVFEQNGSFSTSPQQVQLTQHNGKILISCSAMGDLYEFDPVTEELKFIEINHHLVPNRLSGEINNRPNSEESFMVEMAKVNEQIHYRQPHWDSERKIFLRLATKVFKTKTPEEKNRYEYFLLAYDQNFKLLGETKLDLKERIDYNVFFKDGKLWSYVNVEDDLGFAVFTFNF